MTQTFHISEITQSSKCFPRVCKMPTVISLGQM